MLYELMEDGGAVGHNAEWYIVSVKIKVIGKQLQFITTKTRKDKIQSMRNQSSKILDNEKAYRGME